MYERNILITKGKEHLHLEIIHHVNILMINEEDKPEVNIETIIMIEIN